VAGTTYTYNGVGWTLAQSTIATVTQIKVITASGSYVPSSGLLSAIVECVGGGAGGGGTTGTASQTYAGGGGGSGAYSRKILTAAQIGASQAVIIGAGGNGGAAGNNNGVAGGDTSFGSLCLAKGGLPGTYAAGGVQVSTGGAGGAAASGVGDVTASGAPGIGGVYSGNPSLVVNSGAGGSSIFGGGAPASTWTSAASITGVNATNYGGGGSGSWANGTGAAGGNGAPGVCIVTEFIAVSAVPVPGFPVQIARVDVSVAVAAVDFTSGIDATYDEYELHLINVTVAANGQPALRISQDGGATWKAGTSDYLWSGRYIPFGATMSGNSDQGGTTTSMGLTGSAGTNMMGSTTNGINGIVKFWRPWATAFRKTFLYDTTFQNPINGMTSFRGAGNYAADDNAFNGLRLLVGGTTFTAGTFILYGIKK
jgi:hypothetical protein